MFGLISYLAGPGKREEHINQRVVAASSSSVFRAGGAGAVMGRDEVRDLADVLEEARVVFGIEVTRKDTKKYRAAIERGEDHRSAVLTATNTENVWHCSLAVQPAELQALGVTELDDATWSAIAHDFMTGMGFTAPGDAPAAWVAVHHGKSVNGNDHIHIAASRIRQDGTIVQLFQPHPETGRAEGDMPRAQRVCREIAAQRGLRVVGNPAQGAPSTPAVGRGHDASAERAGLAEAPQDELRRRVGVAASTSESEAEFVRMVRADGILINPYFASDDVVTGYSVGFPTDRFADRYGRPIMHGAARKLGADFTLPRLRERWIDTDGAREDAVAAWHTAAADMPPTSTTAGRKKAAEHTDHARAAEQDRRTQRREHAERLGALIAPIAQRSTTEAEFARALRAHPDIAIRPRYARGSTDIVGYVAALRPPTGERPVWCGASYIPGANLTDLRGGWSDTAESRRDAATAWASRRTPAGGKQPKSARSVATDATRWQQKVAELPHHNSAGWARAAGDTAAVCAAAAQSMTGPQQRALNNLADTLRESASVRRPSRRPASTPATAACRIAATMIAATREDTALLWLTVMAQIAGAARAIGDYHAACGHTYAAAKVTVAIADVRALFPDVVPTTRAAGGPRTAQAEHGTRPEHLRRPNATQMRPDRAR